MIESFTGALAAIVVLEVGYVVKDYIEYRLELRQHKQYCKKNNLPYIKPADANKALENFMNKPIEEFVEAIKNDEDGELNNYKICPKCLEYKRNFLTEGRGRECMDCAIGGLSDN